MSTNSKDQRVDGLVFDQAIKTTSWTLTNIGAVTEICHRDGYRYRVVVDLELDQPARIDWRYGWGGTEPFGWRAPPQTTTRLRRAATLALQSR